MEPQSLSYNDFILITNLLIVIVGLFTGIVSIKIYKKQKSLGIKKVSVKQRLILLPLLLLVILNQLLTFLQRNERNHQFNNTLQRQQEVSEILERIDRLNREEVK